MLTEILFLILALIILIGSIKALSSEELVHALVYLALTLGGIAGIYLTLGAEFLAAIQILVYVGAVITLFLFAVMLTTPATPTEGFAEDRTPLSVLGIEAPRGMDVESMEEVSEDAETVADAEAEVRAADETPSEDEGAVEEADADPEDDQPPEASESDEAPDDLEDGVEEPGDAEPAEDDEEAGGADEDDDKEAA